MFLCLLPDTGVVAKSTEPWWQNRTNRAGKTAPLDSAANVRRAHGLWFDQGYFDSIEPGLPEAFEQCGLFRVEMISPNECVSAKLHVRFHLLSNFRTEIIPFYLVQRNPDRHLRPNPLQKAACQLQFVYCSR